MDKMEETAAVGGGRDDLGAELGPIVHFEVAGMKWESQQFGRVGLPTTARCVVEYGCGCFISRN